MSLHKPVLLIAALLSVSAPAHAAPTDVEAEAPDVKTSAQEAAAPEVGSSGAYSDSIPLDLPAGRQEMTPEISLSYSSHGDNGPLGQGWSLTGFPAIVRTNGGSGIRLGAGDTYGLAPSWGAQPGPQSRLVSIGGSYHLAKDNRQRFFAVGTCGTGQPCYWKMHDGSGRIYYFGRAPRSYYQDSSPEILSEAGGPSVVAWGLSRVEDDHGNA